MSRELFWLTLTAIMTGLMWTPYIVDRVLVRGLMGAMDNPSPNAKPHSSWAWRQMHAHDNAVENLVIYTLGVPVLRTLTFVAAFAAEVVLVLAIFRVV